MVLGGRTKNIETFVPGTTSGPGAVTASCYGTFNNNLNTGGTLPVLLNPVAQYDGLSNKLFFCGRNSAAANKFECYSFLRGDPSWKLITFTDSIADYVPNTFLWFLKNRQIWIVSDSNPLIIDLVTLQSTNQGKGQTYWDTVGNPPTVPCPIRSEPGGCVVAAGDFVFLIGGATNAIRRLYIRGLGIGNTVLPPADGVRKWEQVGTLPVAGTDVYPYCATVPSNRNQIMIEVGCSTGKTSLIYDTITNTFTSFPFTTDLSAPLVELCKAWDSVLYAFPIGNGAKAYSPTLVGGTNWVTVNSTGSLPTVRTNPAVVLVPVAFTSLVGCKGC